MYIIENQYFSSFNYYSDLYNNTNIKIMEYFKWYKMSFLNRCIISGANGPINLTVPIKGGRNLKALYNEVYIDYSTDWQKQHLRAIMSSYAKSPYYEYYYWWFEDLYKIKFDTVLNLNNYILMEVLSKLKLDIEITNVSAEMNVDIINTPGNLKKWLPNNYKTLCSNVKYLQVFEDKIGFLPNLSIIDGIFNLGPQLNLILKKHAEILKTDLNS